MLIKYAPLYISVLITGLVMIFLFLRPGEAFGLNVEVEAEKKFANFPAGFQLAERVLITADVVINEGEFAKITGATFEVKTADGGAGFINFENGVPNPAVNLPLPTSGDIDSAGNNFSIEFQELTSQLPTSGGLAQGKLFYDVFLSTADTLPDAFGYGYGYQGQQGGGRIKFTIKYHPPEIVGKYIATVKVDFEGGELASSATEFNILGALMAADVTSLPTLYPIGETEAIPGDLVVQQLDVTAAKINNIVSVTRTGDLGDTPSGLIAVSNLNPALREKWGIDPSADFFATTQGPSKCRAGDLHYQFYSKGLRWANLICYIYNGGGEHPQCLQCVSDAPFQLHNPAFAVFSQHSTVYRR